MKDGVVALREYRRRESPIEEEQGGDEQPSLCERRHLLGHSADFAGLDIINLFKDAMKLEMSSVYPVAANAAHTESKV